MSAVTEFAPGVKFERAVEGDRYFGKPEALIAAGLVTAQQVPGWPGMPPTSVRFIDGVQQPRGNKAKHDERFMQVTRIGGKIQVTKGISVEEERRRRAARAAEIEEAERNRPKKDIGIDGAAKALRDASTVFAVGATVLADGSPCVITGEYRLRVVHCDDGEFVASNGSRFEYRWGYTGRFRSGEEYFFAAHQICLGEDHAPTHIRAIRGSSTKATGVGRTVFTERQ